jgi:hypothetical protein
MFLHPVIDSLKMFESLVYSMYISDVLNMRRNKITIIEVRVRLIDATNKILFVYNDFCSMKTHIDRAYKNTNYPGTGRFINSTKKSTSHT